MSRIFFQVGGSALFGVRFAVMPGVFGQVFWENYAGVGDADLTARQKEPTSISSIFV
jgi:hypothetical protein